MLVQLKKAYPFVTWDPARRRGDSGNEFYALYIETAKKKAGAYPFHIYSGTEHNDADRAPFEFAFREFSSLDDALEYFNECVELKARQCGWTPEAKA